MKKVLISFAVCYLTSFASESFSKGDWEVVCDNTNNCKLAGYTENTLNDEYFPISILFERKAGANSKINSSISVSEEDDNFKTKNNSFKMTINNKTYNIDLNKKLPDLQTNIILDALVSQKEIYFIYGDTYEWNFSQNGSFATMLKMDDYQKRVGTIGAIYKKGNKNEDNVLKENPLPVITVPQVYSNNKYSIPKITLKDKDKKLLQNQLKEFYGENKECYAEEDLDNNLNIYRVTDKIAIASQPCWMAAYNFADAFWIINTQPPFEPKYIDLGTDIYSAEDGTLRISNEYKGRGIGDCWGRNELIWNGEKFVDSLISSTGLCRGFAGGAWDLPSFVSKIEIKNKE